MGAATRKSFDLLDLERVIWNDTLSSALTSELTGRGSTRPFLVTSRSSRKVPAVEALIGASDTPLSGMYCDIVPHVSRQSVMELIASVRAADADVIITVGGGSAIDTVKVALVGLAAKIGSADELDGYAIRYKADGQRIVPQLPPSRLRQIVAPCRNS